MHEDQVSRLVKLLSYEEIEHLRRLRSLKAESVSDFASFEHVLKSLEVHDLVFRTGSVVSLTHRGKLVAQRV